MKGPRRPKDLDQYTDADMAARSLEQYAADLRKNAIAGERVKWTLNVRFWNDAWDTTPKPEVYHPFPTCTKGCGVRDGVLAFCEKHQPELVRETGSEQP